MREAYLLCGAYKLNDVVTVPIRVYLSESSCRRDIKKCIKHRKSKPFIHEWWSQKLKDELMNRWLLSNPVSSEASYCTDFFFKRIKIHGLKPKKDK